MRRIKGAKPSPALLVAVVALVAALAGTAIGGVAVTSLNKKDKKQVTKIAKKQAKKLDRKIELTPGPKGDPGANGATDVTRRVSDLTTVPADQYREAEVLCEPGERAVGGGGRQAGPGVNPTADSDLIASAPAIFTRPTPDPGAEGEPVGWGVTYRNRDVNNSNTGDIQVYAYAVCAAP